MARGGYTPNEIREMEYLEIMFIYHYQEQSIYEQQQFLTSILGVVWEKDKIVSSLEESKKNVGGVKKPLDKLFIPLSLAVNPDVMDFVQSQFGVGGKLGKVSPDGVIKNPYIAGGEYIPKAGEVIMSTESMPKDDFLNLIGKGRKNVNGKVEKK